jgi:hypothetical protein
LCAERACTSPLASVPTSGELIVSPIEIPTGTVFWRLRLGRDVSATWQVVVASGHRMGTGVWFEGADLNGDGMSELIVGAPRVSGEGRTAIYNGSSRPDRGLPAELHPTAGDWPNRSVGFGNSVSPAGDVDGDGFADLVVTAGAPGAGSFAAPEDVYVFRGSAEGAIAEPLVTIRGTTWGATPSGGDRVTAAAAGYSVANPPSVLAMI